MTSRHALYLYLAVLPVPTFVHDPGWLAAGLAAALVLAGPSRGAILRKSLVAIALFNLTTSLGVVALGLWRGQIDSDWLVLANLRVLLMSYLTFWFAARVNVLAAVSGWPAATVLVALALGQMRACERLLREGQERAVVPGQRLARQARERVSQLALRLGHLAVPFLDPLHYWGTDASLALMRRGRDLELADASRLPLHHLVEDADFSLPGVPDTIDFAIAFGVFTHLPATMLRPALASVRARLPRLDTMLLTVFLAPPGHPGAHRQPDGVVTHPDRPPYHRTATAVEADAAASGFTLSWQPVHLPRGQALCHLKPA